MSRNEIPWGDNPARKQFEIDLANTQGQKLKLHQTYAVKSFGSKEKNAIRASIDSLPESPHKKLSFHFLEHIGDPPPTYKIKTFLFKARNEKRSQSHYIMADQEVYNLATGLYILQADSHTVKMELSNMPIPPHFSLEELDRFRYQYWNVSYREDWSLEANTTLKNLIQSEPTLAEAFKPLLEGAYSNKGRSEMAMHYNLTPSPGANTREFRKGATLALQKQNHHLECGEYEQANICSNILSRTVNTGNKVGVTVPTKLEIKSTIVPDTE